MAGHNSPAIITSNACGRTFTSYAFAGLYDAATEKLTFWVIVLPDGLSVILISSR